MTTFQNLTNMNSFNTKPEFLPFNAQMVTDTYICEVSPELAYEWLKRNTNNRKLKLSEAIKHAKEIKLDNWECNHQPVAFDYNGNLIDGQHRLYGVIKAEKSISIRATINCPPESMKTVDTGKSRSNADMLTLSGHKNASRKAATIKQILNYYTHSAVCWNNSICVFSALQVEQKLEELYEQDLDIENIFVFAKKCNNRNKLMMFTPTAAFCILACEHGFSYSVIETYLWQIATGLNITEKDITYRLRTKWQNATKDDYPHSIKAQKKLAELIIGFKAYSANIKVRSFPDYSMLPMPLFK